MNISFLDEASDEFFVEVERYEVLEKGLGLRFKSEVEMVVRKVAENPLLWRERPGGYRRVNFSVFPYYVAYFVRGEDLVVAAIAHGSREPGYWRSRLRD